MEKPSIIDMELQTKARTNEGHDVKLNIKHPLPVFLPVVLPAEPEPRGQRGKHSPPSRVAAPADQAHQRLPYMPALDGLRALAVLAVLAYHAGLGWARAGFLGVDVFFVISGYLITALLLNEWRLTGKINLVAFWRRRALRLLPALLVLLAVVAAAVPLVAPDQSSRLRGDLLAALTYVSNWRLVLQDLPYFQAVGRPPVLQHLWSLAVEEQFYLAWPIALAVGLAIVGRPRKLVRWILLGAGLSGLLMAILYSPEADSSRVYYGTDTRVGTILIGACLAFLWAPGRRTANATRRGRHFLDAAGLGALLALAWCINRLTEFDPRLYRGGFTAVAVLAAVVIAVTAYPGSTRVQSLLGSGPMVWLGKRSYGIYLWHWPVFMVTRPYSDIPLSGVALLVLRLSVTLALAALSYRFVEQPVRAGNWGGVIGGLRGKVNLRSLRPAAIAFASVAVLAAVAITAGVVVQRPAPASQAARAIEDVQKESVFMLTSATEGAETPATLVLTPVAPGAGAPLPPIPAPGSQARPLVSAIGESVLLEAKGLLLARLGGGVLIEADVGRHVRDNIKVIQGLRDRGQLGDDVIIHIGQNGPITRKQIDELMGLLKDVPRVILVNVKVSRPWESVNNEVLAESAGRFPNTKLLDWHKLAVANPRVFYDDGVHLRPQGVRLYTELLMGSLTK